VPRNQLSGWLNTVAGFNPVTYLLAGLRSIVMGNGWQWTQLGQALMAIAIVGAISMSMCFAALRGRIKSG
jgi:ABC-2 type transport system permease protein